MNILITGASGTVGFETIKHFLESDKKTSITVFDLYSPKVKKCLRIFKNKVEIVYGNISNYSEVEEVCKNKDIVIHLAAIIPPLADEKPELAEKVNVEGTKNIIEALKKHSPKAMLIYSSSISVYGDRINTPNIKTTDELKPSPRDEYAKTKIKAEKLVQNSGLKWTIFRLTAIFGIGNHRISKIMFHMPLNTPIEICTPEDTGRALMKAAFNIEKLNGKIFNLGGGENCRISYKKFLSISFNIFGLGKVDFPGLAFAKQNFHCAYYEDGQELEDILHFRKDSIESYFFGVKKHIKPVNKFFSKIFSPLIQKTILLKSEPYRALRKNKEKEIAHYFGIFFPKIE
ncbi:MAG: NAD(P)-dependent oxidoreductase [Bacteroidales bacterium]|nr:NAD(P)-dependent oxidoreductase [Bacteroidales bacterium]